MSCNTIYKSVGVIVKDGGVLFVRAKDNEYWSFPGGKLKDGENPEQALIREIKEELGIELDPGQFRYMNEYERASGKNPGKVSHVSVFWIDGIDYSSLAVFEEIEEMRWVEIERFEEDDIKIGGVYKEEIMPDLRSNFYETKASKSI